MSRRRFAHEQRCSDLRFEVADWFAWSPSLECRAAWRDWAGAPVAANDSQPVPTLPMMLRRRLSPFGQKLVGQYWSLDLR